MAWKLVIDLSKAFNSLNHFLLLCKLKDYGIDESTLPWLCSYLKNRFQKTVFDNTESSYMSVSHGVPQGSTLGPLLYIIYVNDCFEKVIDETSTTIMNADDTVLLSRGNTLDEGFATNQLLFNQYINWADVNCLNIHVSKTKNMTLCSRNKKFLFTDNKHIFKNGCAMQCQKLCIFRGRHQ